MQLNARVQETRERVNERATELVDALQDRGAQIRDQASDALDHGRGRMIQIEAQAVSGAREALSRARAVLGDRAPFLARAEDALTETLIALKAQHDLTLPIDDFDTLSIKRIKPFLDGLDAEDLKVVRAYEVANKNRVTLLAAIDRLLAPPAAA